MSLNKEGFKMDPKLAETMARIEAEHPAANATDEAPVTTSKRDLFAEMYPLLTKKLQRGKDGGAAQQ